MKRTDLINLICQELGEIPIDLKLQPEHQYSDLMSRVIYPTVKEEEEAESYWREIFYRHESNDKKLSLRYSAFEYFLKVKHMMKKPVLIEYDVLDRILKKAIVDGLTGLYNRSYFENSLKKETKRAARHHHIYSIFLLDIDDFKYINDSQGHVFGDEVLRKFAHALQKACREEDTVYRYGGEEFIFILPETSRMGALRFAERLKLQLSHDGFLKKNNISFSGGIAEYPADSSNIMTLIKNADSAMYKAKNAGKDSIFVYNHYQAQSANDGLTGLFNRHYFQACVHREFKRALRHDRVFSLVCMEIDGFEALMEQQDQGVAELVLKESARILRNQCRDEDVIARWGGNEFCLMLSEIAVDGAMALLKRLRLAFKENSFLLKYDISFSAGVSTFPSDSSGEEELFFYARQALRQAKNAGHNQIICHFFNRRKHERYEKPLRIEIKPFSEAFEANHKSEVTLSDISLGGISVSMKNHYKQNSQLLIRFKNAQDETSEIILFGRVIWFREKDSLKDEYRYGIKFSDIHKNEKEKLSKLIEA
ncbi:MAG: diguanylate cyclase [Spirochaetales bacterium]|nr:diguanylate cyclase [Spirochaetales bacterium]